MLIIAHRANMNGPSPAENRPDYIQKALDAGFLVEVDVWGKELDEKSEFVWLGHDAPVYQVSIYWLLKEGLFVHCKDLAALWHCKALGVEHYFSHNRDDVVLTSSNYFWTYPDSNIKLCKDSIPVIFGKNTLWKEEILSEVAGICTDYAVHYDALFNQGAV